MTGLSNNFRRIAAGALALLIVSGGVPMQPAAELFGSAAITAGAAFDIAQDPITYTDENGNEQTASDYTVLTGSEDRLDPGTYVVNSDITYKDPLLVCGDVRLILCDGCTMTISPGINGINGYEAILSIYGQSEGTGKLSIVSDSAGLWLEGQQLILNGGVLEIVGKGVGIMAEKIDLNKGSLNISDGVGICSSHEATVTLGGARVAINHYDFVNLTYDIKEGLSYTDGTNIYDSTTHTADIAALKGSVLRVVSSYSIRVPASGLHGTAISPKKAFEGFTVTMTVVPDKGYNLKSIYVNRGTVEVTDNKDGTYSFTMPGRNVTVIAEFAITNLTYVPAKSATCTEDGNIEYWYDEENNKYFSDAVVVTPKPADTKIYPDIISIDFNEEYHQFRLSWNKVPKAQNYGVAVYLSGKWKIMTKTIHSGTTSYTSPKLRAGQTYKMLVCAKVNGQWDLSGMNSRAFKITVK